MRLSKRLQRRIKDYLEGNLPMKIHTSSPTAVTARFAGKVPFHFQLPESQQPMNGPQIYQINGSRLINFRGAHAALTTYEMRGEKISLLVVPDNSARAEGGEAVPVRQLDISLSHRWRFQSDHMEQPWAYVCAGFLVARLRAAVLPRLPSEHGRSSKVFASMNSAPVVLRHRMERSTKRGCRAISRTLW